MTSLSVLNLAGVNCFLAGLYFVGGPRIKKIHMILASLQFAYGEQVDRKLNPILHPHCARLTPLSYVNLKDRRDPPV